MMLVGLGEERRRALRAEELGGCDDEALEVFKDQSALFGFLVQADQVSED
jgi:hypothetical protein